MIGFHAISFVNVLTVGHYQKLFKLILNYTVNQLVINGRSIAVSTSCGHVMFIDHEYSQEKYNV